MTFRDEFSTGRRETGWAFFTSLPMIVMMIIATLAIIGGITMVMKPFQVINKVTDPDRMIYTYEWFHDQYGRIEAVDTQIAQKDTQITELKNMFGDPLEWRRETRQEYTTLNTEFTGLKQHRASLVESYNAASRKETRNFFKDGELPQTIR